MKSEISPVVVTVVVVVVLCLVIGVGVKLLNRGTVTDTAHMVKPPAGMNWQEMQKLQQNNPRPETGIAPPASASGTIPAGGRMPNLTQPPPP